MPVNIKRAIKITSVILLVFAVLLISIAYLRYRDLKKTLIAKIADEATLLIGQKVEINDLSIGTASGIDIYDISVKNPEGFISGELLRIKKLHLKMKYSDLIGKKISFQNITVYSPELTLAWDKEGRINISAKLLEFFGKKPTITYQIDEFIIKSGAIDFNQDKRFRSTDINMHVKNLSSNPGMKTLFKGDTSYAGSRIRIDGWAYRKDEPGKFNMSVISDEMSLAAFRETFKKYELSTEKTKAAINLLVEGDMQTGVNVKMGLHVRDIGLPQIRDELKNIRCNMEAFLNLNQDSIQVGDLSFNADEILSLRGNAIITNIGKAPVYHAALKVSKADLSAIHVRDGLMVSGLLSSDSIQIKGTFQEMLPEMSGTLSIRNAALQRDSRKNIFKDAMLDILFQVKDKDTAFKADMKAGKISTNISGIIKHPLEKDRYAEIRIHQPEVKLTDIREVFWDVFPDSLIYAGLEGSLSAEVRIQHADSLLKVNGGLTMKDLVLRGENGEYAVGPVNGAVPVAYRTADRNQRVLPGIPSFERSEFDNLRKRYSEQFSDDGYSRITVGSLSYGFKFLEDINIWIRQEGDFLNIGRFSGKILEGRLNGSAVVDISDNLNYRLGMHVDGISLAKLCESIEPIKGYISGKLNGITSLKGTGSGFSGLIGIADFWTYSTRDEQTKISREFLQKIGGPSLRTYLGDRRFDKGVMKLYLKNGFVIFQELELANRNIIGMKDLSVKVAPISNRIALDHLMWSITAAAQRAKKE